MSIEQDSTKQHPADPGFRHKAISALLAAMGGAIGLHRLYLRQRYWWLPLSLTVMAAPWLIGVKDWYLKPAFFVLMVGVVAGFIEALVLALTADEKFDAKFNPKGLRRNQSGWGAVLIAVMTMLIGSIVLLTTIALLNQVVVEWALGARP